MEPISTSEAAAPTGGIAEFQGLYGAYHVSETLLQKLWLRREFDQARARTLEGTAIRVLDPGTWNRLAGPDFLNARIAFGERIVTGDVEVHFRAEAWNQHGHGRDRAYDNVILHVVLFPPPPDAPAIRTRTGRELPLLALVDLLWHDLEEYAADDAVTALGGQDVMPVVEELLALAPAERAQCLHAAAVRRWLEKVHFARLRCARAPWAEACHQTALEILGYRSNRAAMLRTAWAFPWREWRRRAPEVDELVDVAATSWTLRGVRPANHPRRRLQQYQAWMARVPDWPERLRRWRLPVVPAGTTAEDAARVRRDCRLHLVRDALAGGICGMELGGTRLDTWICNLVLPFLAAAQAAPAAEALWLVWYPGDAPDALLGAARCLRPPGVRGALANGTLEALLGLQLARAQAAATAAPEAG